MTALRLRATIERAIDQHTASLDLAPTDQRNEVAIILAEYASQLGFLEKLRLARCELGPDAMDVLGGAFVHLPALNDLDLGNNAIGSDGFARLGEYTAELRHLRSLAVYKNGIGPIGLAGFLARTELLPELDYLDLEGNGIGDEGAKALSLGDKKMPCLRGLMLFDCGIGDVGVECLIDSVRRRPWCDTLVSIGFRNNPVSWMYEPLCYVGEPSQWRVFGRPAKGPSSTGIGVLLKEALSKLHLPPQEEDSVEIRVTDRSRGLRKGQVAEIEKSLLALLKTCLESDKNNVSERKLHRSALLKAHRRSFGLAERISQSSIRNHLDVLAHLCGLESIVLLDGKRQQSRLHPEAEHHLKRVRPKLERRIKTKERQAIKRNQGPPDKSKSA